MYTYVSLPLHRIYFYYVTDLFFSYNAKRASMVQSRIKQLERLPELQPVEKEPEAVLKFPDIEKLSGCVIQLSEVSFRYSENLPTCFTNVDLSANADSRICIVSTFMDFPNFENYRGFCPQDFTKFLAKPATKILLFLSSRSKQMKKVLVEFVDQN